MAEPKLVFRDVTPERWEDFARLFESRGAPSYCWCMAWRPLKARDDKAARRAAMEAQVREGTPVGILGYLDEEPVAWCSIAPKETYRPLGGPDPGPGERVWSVACFFVRRNLRRQGVGDQLLQAAIAHARAKGATAVEAYPVDPDSPSYRFMGFVARFEEAGFEKVGAAGSRRHVMRLAL